MQGNRSYDVRKPTEAEKQRWKQMVAFQFLMPGAPYIYYGDEVGMWGADDPDCRKPMVWSDLKYETERQHPFGVPRSVDSVAVDSELLKFYEEWAKRRQGSEVLRRGSFEIALSDDTRRLFAFRRSLGRQEIVAIFNASASNHEIEAGTVGIQDIATWQVGLEKGTALRNTLVISARGHTLVTRQTPLK